MKCTAMKHRSTEPCDREALPGVAVCEKHGAGSPQSRARSEMVVAERELDAMVTPLAHDDPMRNPAWAMQAEHDRTVARIRWLEAKIAVLTADELTFGVTKIETIGASETPGVNVTQEARVHVYERLLAAERAHLLKVDELLAKQHFQAASHIMEEQLREKLLGISLDIAEALGRKRDDPRVRKALARVFSKGTQE